MSQPRAVNPSYESRQSPPNSNATAVVLSFKENSTELENTNRFQNLYWVATCSSVYREIICTVRINSTFLKRNWLLLSPCHLEENSFDLYMSKVYVFFLCCSPPHAHSKKNPSSYLFHTKQRWNALMKSFCSSFASSRIILANVLLLCWLHWSQLYTIHFLANMHLAHFSIKALWCTQWTLKKREMTQNANLINIS